MAELIRANFNELVPNLSLAGQGFEQGQRISQNMANRDALQQQQQQRSQLSGLQQKAAGGDQEALQQVAGLDPQAAAQIQSILANQDEATRAEGLRENDVLTRTALDALNIEDPTERRLFLERKKGEFSADGRNTKNIERALSLDDNGMNQAITMQARQGQSIKDLAQQQFPDTVKSVDQGLRERQVAVAEASEQRQAGKLSAGLEKALLASQDNVVTAQRNANEYTTLAGDFDRIQDDLPAGTRQTFSESLKSILGTQDDVSEFRRRFNKVRLSEGLKSLPPGPATDTDVVEAFKGVPKETASPEQVASFLRGAARLARFDAGYNQFKADFISKNSSAKNLNKNWRKTIASPVVKRGITVAEIYETAQNRNITPDEVAEKLGVTLDGLI